MVRSLAFGLLLALFPLLACSSSRAGDRRAPGTAGATRRSSRPTRRGRTARSSIRPTVIDANVTVTIAAGAMIQAIDGITITVNGTLKSGRRGAATLDLDERHDALVGDPGGQRGDAGPHQRGHHECRRRGQRRSGAASAELRQRHDHGFARPRSYGRHRRRSSRPRTPSSKGRSAPRTCKGSSTRRTWITMPTARTASPPRATTRS